MAAIVERDRSGLLRLGASEEADPWMYVDDYGGRTLRLVMPPGPIESWPGHVYRAHERPGWSGVEVEVFDSDIGMTDLTLKLDLHIRDDGTIDVRFRSLHVM